MPEQTPEHLSADAAGWYDRLRDEYGIQDEAGRLMLQTAMEAFDRMREAQAAIRVDGLTVKDRFDQTKTHPAATVERDSRSQLMQALKALNLDIDTETF